MNIFHILALIFFVIAALPIPTPKVGWTAIGLAFLTAGFLWPKATL